jgi:hypothetical protein
MKHYLSAALTIKTKWFDSLKEWFLWNRFIGVEHFYIVDDNKDKPLKDFFKNFSDQITFIDDIKKDQSISQRELFQIIYNRHRGESHWMAFIDDDEYIMSLQDLTFVNFLKSIEDKRGVELNSRFFGPHGYHKHEGLKCHENNLILDRYWLYESKPIVKSIVNSKIVSSLAEGSGPHRLVPSGVIDCFGNDVEPIEDTVVSSKWGITDKIVNNQGAIHNPRFIINHYGLKSLEEIEYKLFERGAFMERTSENRLLYRTHQLIQQLFSTTKSINQNHKVNFNNFYFKSCLPHVRLEFKQYCEDHKDKF